MDGARRRGMTKENPPATEDRPHVRVGYVNLLDAAPLVAAARLGLFEREGLRVSLSREVGWATVRDKVLTGELDAAQAPAPMLWAARLGIGAPAFAASTALVLNLHGNAICLSNRLRVWGVHDATSLRVEAMRRRGERKLVFGVVYPFSSHNIHLRAWLRSCGLVPDKDVRIAVVPPAQMLATLAAGTLDGFMAGEPWTSLAVARGDGWCAACSASLFPGHVEKVLMVREEYLRTHAHAALLRAITAAAAWCDEPRNRAAVADMMAAPEALGIPADILRSPLCGPYDFGHGRRERVPDFHIFHAGDAHVPDVGKAQSIQHDLMATGLLPEPPPAGLCSRLFRPDVLEEALAESGVAIS